MHAGKMTLMILAAGALALGLGSGAVLAATDGAMTPGTATTSAVKASTDAKPAVTNGQHSTEARESKGMQTTERAAARRTADREVRGVVTHVDLGSHPKTLVMNATRFALATNPKAVTDYPAHGSNALVIGVDILPSSRIVQGKRAVALSAVRGGDEIWMKYDRTSDHLRADQIRIVKPATSMARVESK